MALAVVAQDWAPLAGLVPLVEGPLVGACPLAEASTETGVVGSIGPDSGARSHPRDSASRRDRVAVAAVVLGELQVGPRLAALQGLGARLAEEPMLAVAPRLAMRADMGAVMQRRGRLPRQGRLAMGAAAATKQKASRLGRRWHGLIASALRSRCRHRIPLCKHLLEAACGGDALPSHRSSRLVR